MNLALNAKIVRLL